MRRVRMITFSGRCISAVLRPVLWGLTGRLHAASWSMEPAILTSQPVSMISFHDLFVKLGCKVLLFLWTHCYGRSSTSRQTFRAYYSTRSLLMLFQCAVTDGRLSKPWWC